MTEASSSGGLKLTVRHTCKRCDGLGEWDEGPTNTHFGCCDPEDPEYDQVTCPDCDGKGSIEMKMDVKPCPHCGSSDVFVERSDYSCCYVFCNSCSAKGPTSDGDDDAEETPGESAAISAWNIRAPLPVLKQVEEALAQIVRATSVPTHKREDAEFLRASCSIAKSIADATLSSIREHLS